MLPYKGIAIKKFRKVHIEITNICNLACSFCPPKVLPNQTMSLEMFKKINQEVKSYTNELAYHIVGDPLVLSNLNAYLDISLDEKLKVHLTTTGNNLEEKHFESLSHQAIKQVNFSINSYNANSHKKSLEEYLRPIFLFASFVVQHQKELFINFRIWNLDDSNSAKVFNQAVFDLANTFFGTQLHLDTIYAQEPKNIKVARKVFFNFDEYFEWPSLENSVFEPKGYCHGLSSHFGILSSGVVVPCCLDKDGIINLGNLQKQTLETILTSKRAFAIQQGFQNTMAVEELCQKCTYKTRFDERIQNG